MTVLPSESESGTTRNEPAVLSAHVTVVFCGIKRAAR